jgi:type II secretory pathway component PulF
MLIELDLSSVAPVFHVLLIFLLVGVLVLWGIIAFTLQNILIGRFIWWHVPFAGLHFHLLEEAALARNLALMLTSGATLERALQEIVSAHAGGPLQKNLAAVTKALALGVAPARAFRENGKWRPELLWALDALAQGAPPATTLDAVADVLEEKACTRLDRICRVCTPLAIIIAAIGVGVFGWTIFGALEKIEWKLIR